MVRRRSRNGGGGSFLGGSGNDLFQGLILGTVANLIAGVVMGGAIGAFIEEKLPMVSEFMPGSGEPAAAEAVPPVAESSYGAFY